MRREVAQRRKKRRGVQIRPKKRNTGEKFRTLVQKKNLRRNIRKLRLIKVPQRQPKNDLLDLL